MVITNAWYPVAHSKDIGRKLFARQICGEPLVLFRQKSGTPAALEDRCRHRFAPLSLGQLIEDRVQCGYHGLEYSASGECVKIPCQERVSAAVRVKSYPTVDRHNFVWVWIGDATMAEPRLIPDLHWNDDPKWPGDGSTLHIKCNYQLLIDNLLDLTHETYVHARSAGHPMITATPPKVDSTEDTVTVGRIYGPLVAPPPWGRWVEQGLGWSGQVFRYHYSRFSKPCIVNIETGAVRADASVPNEDPSQSIRGYLINCCVPETETSCWHLWSWPRNYAVDDHRFTAQVIDEVNAIFLEDIEMLEAQQRNILRDPDRKPLSIASDAGPLTARRIIERAVLAANQLNHAAG